MKYIKHFESLSKGKILIIVDVQRSFKKYFTDNYLSELNNYCLEFDKVYQIWDNHSDGKNPDLDFLYDENPDIENKDDLYKFNNQVELIEKRYTYNVNVDFFKKILDESIYKEIKTKAGNLKVGDYFPTTEGTIIVYTGNNHQWMHVPKKLYNLFLKLKGKNVVLTGGAKFECIFDLAVVAKSLGVNITENEKYIYSATSCPIK